MARYSVVFVFYYTQNVKIDFLKFNLLPNEPIESSWDALWLGIRPSPSPPSSLRLGFLRTHVFSSRVWCSYGGRFSSFLAGVVFGRSRVSFLFLTVSLSFLSFVLTVPNPVFCQLAKFALNVEKRFVTSKLIAKSN